MLKCRRAQKYFKGDHPFVYYLLMKQSCDNNSAENSGNENNQTEFQTVFMGCVKILKETESFKNDESNEIFEM